MTADNSYSISDFLWISSYFLEQQFALTHKHWKEFMPTSTFFFFFICNLFFSYSEEWGYNHFVIMFATSKTKFLDECEILNRLSPVGPYVRLCGICFSNCPGRKDEDNDFKFGKNIESFCAQAGVGNGPNWTEYKAAVKCKLNLSSCS